MSFIQNEIEITFFKKNILIVLADFMPKTPLSEKNLTLFLAFFFRFLQYYFHKFHFTLTNKY